MKSVFDEHFFRATILYATCVQFLYSQTSHIAGLHTRDRLAFFPMFRLTYCLQRVGAEIGRTAAHARRVALHAEALSRLVWTKAGVWERAVAAAVAVWIAAMHGGIVVSQQGH